MADEFYKTSSSTHYDQTTGKLYIFRSDSVQVIRGWPEPMAWRKTTEQPVWSHFRPDITVSPPRSEGRTSELTHVGSIVNSVLDLPDPFSDADDEMPQRREMNQRERAYHRWSETIPDDIRAIVSRYPDRHWHMLAFLARCGEAARDLALANPALAYMLASNWVFHKPRVNRPLRSARALLARGKSQRDILGWLGFPATKAARKVLRKIVEPSIRIRPLLYLRDTIGDPDVAKLLAHLKRINAGVIRIVTDARLRPLVSPSCLQEVSESRLEDSHPRTAYLLGDTLNMHTLMNPPEADLPVFTRVMAVQDLHEALIEEMWESEISRPNADFPPPPVKGTSTIVPITTWEELVEEGRVQHNCVASYGNRIAVGRKVYIYRVLAPERCTLSLVKQLDGWVLGEIKRACNQPVSRATLDSVDRWLASSGGPETIYHPDQLQFEYDAA